MSEETFWEEQTQRGKASVWFVVGPDGRDATLEQLQEPLLFSEDLSKDLGSAKDPANTHKSPPESSCQLCSPASCVRVVHLQPSAPSSPQAFRRPEEHRMLLGSGSALRDTDFHLLTCPKLSWRPGRSPVRQLLPTPLQRLKVLDFKAEKSAFGGLLHGDAGGCSCCGANADKSWVPRRRRGAAVLGAPDWLKLNRLLSAA